MVGLSPAFLSRIFRTTGGVALSKVLQAMLAGIEESGARARVVRIRHTADTSFLGLTAALATAGLGV